MPPAPAVTLITLGGTISSTSEAGRGAAPRLSGREMLALIPGLEELAVVESTDLGLYPSPDLTFELAWQVAAEIHAAAARGCHGVVVSQGTDTVEEFAFCLDLLYAGDVPVAVTGAMRHSALPGSDAAANLLDAVRTVVCPSARALGCLVVFNGEVHSARTVRKAHTSSLSAFMSAEGAIGWISEGAVLLGPRAYPRVFVPWPAGALLRRAGVVFPSFDDDGWWLSAISSNQVPGLVVAGLGGGHVPGWLSEGLTALAGEIPVILASRTGGGAVLRATYGNFSGSETALIAGGLIPAGTLDPFKSRILLSLLLTTGTSREEIRALFERAGYPSRFQACKGTNVMAPRHPDAI